MTANKVLIHNSHHQTGRPDGWSGAPGEAAWVFALNDLIESGLEARGWIVTRVDGDLNDHPEFHADYTAFVAPHYEADVHAPVGATSGCFWGSAANSSTPTQDAKLGAIFWSRYKDLPGVPPDKFQWNNINVTDYYGFRYTSAATPGFLVEHGVGWGADYQWLRDNITKIAKVWVETLVEFASPYGVWQEPLDMVRTFYNFPDALDVKPPEGDARFHGLNAAGIPMVAPQAGGSPTENLKHMVHELGHAYEALLIRDGQTMDALRTAYWQNRGFPGTWQMAWDNGNASWAFLPGESWAEAFLNSVYGVFVREKTYDYQKPVIPLVVREFFQSLSKIGDDGLTADPAVLAKLDLLIDAINQNTQKVGGLAYSLQVWLDRGFEGRDVVTGGPKPGAQP